MRKRRILIVFVGLFAGGFPPNKNVLGYISSVDSVKKNILQKISFSEEKKNLSFCSLRHARFKKFTLRSSEPVSIEVPATLLTPVTVKDARSLIASEVKTLKDSAKEETSSKKRPFDVIASGGLPILVEARIQNRRKHGKTVAFLDLLGDSSGKEDPAYLQALMTTNDLLQCNDAVCLRSEEKENLFKACYRLAARGSRVYIWGYPGQTGNNGELCLVVTRLLLKSCAPEPWAVKQVLKLLKEGSKYASPNAHKVLKISEEKLNKLLDSSSNQFHKETVAVAKVLRELDPPPEKYRQSASEEEEIEAFQTSRLSHLPYLQSSKGEQEEWEVEPFASLNDLTLNGGMSRAPQTLFKINCVVQSRRRLGGWLTFLNLVDISDIEGKPGKRTSKLRAVLQKDVFGELNFRVLVDLYRSGSQVQLVGFLGKTHQSLDPTPLFFVTQAELQLSAWQPAAILSVIEASAKGIIPREEAAKALNLVEPKAANLSGTDTTWEEELDALQDLPKTELWWAAVRLSYRLQSTNSQQGQLTLEQENILEEYNERRTAALKASTIAASPTTAAVTSSLPVRAEFGKQGTIARRAEHPLKSGRDGSWWQKKKAPQIEWMVEQIAKIVQTHPSYGQRPLNIVDIGGGSGELAMAIVARFGDQIQAKVIDINLKQDKILKKLSVRNLPQQVHGLRADATTIDLKEQCDILVGLHACGVLSDVILQHAIETGASFVLCTCCFCSNQSLKIRSKTQAEWLGISSSKVAAVRDIAEVQGNAELAHKAMGTINIMRLEAVAGKFKEMWGEERIVKMNLTTFPSEYSLRNMVLIGEVIHC